MKEKVFEYYGVPFTRGVLADALGCDYSYVCARLKKFDGNASAALKGWKGIDDPDDFAVLVGHIKRDEDRLPSFEEAQNKIMEALGFPPFESKVNRNDENDAKNEENEAEEAEGDIKSGPGEAAEAENVAEDVATDGRRYEEPVENVPDMEDLRTVNTCIKLLKRVQGIPGFGLDIFKDCVGALVAGRSMVFDDLVDWEAMAK